MPVTYEITRLDTGSYKLMRIGHTGKISTPLSFPPDELQQYLSDSVSKDRLDEALRTAVSTGHVTVEADLET